MIREEVLRLCKATFPAPALFGIVDRLVSFCYTSATGHCLTYQEAESGNCHSHRPPIQLAQESSWDAGHGPCKVPGKSKFIGISPSLSCISVQR